MQRVLLAMVLLFVTALPVAAAEKDPPPKLQRQLRETIDSIGPMTFLSGMCGPLLPDYVYALDTEAKQKKAIAKASG